MRWAPILCTLAALAASGCSLKKRAVNTFVDILGEAEKVYLSEEDPELVADALPFNMKTLETLLETSPENRELLLTATKTFSLYAYGFVEPDARELAYADFDRSEYARRRAARLYRRAFAYGMRGLEVNHPGLGDRIKVSPEVAASEIALEDVALAVWTGASLGAAITLSKDDPESTADVAVVGALLERSLELDEDFDSGTAHQFLMTYEAGRLGGDPDKARSHYERALELSDANHPAIWLGWAESVSIATQDRAQFLELVQRTLDFDVEAYPENRLLNVLAQRRARWLRDNVDDFFLPGD